MTTEAEYTCKQMDRLRGWTLSEIAIDPGEDPDDIAFPVLNFTSPDGKVTIPVVVMQDAEGNGCGWLEICEPMEDAS